METSEGLDTVNGYNFQRAFYASLGRCENPKNDVFFLREELYDGSSNSSILLPKISHPGY